ncbi:hypothetical protein DCAR_0522451 [Daucus carota subsp. sativus]|uniref:Cytochrome P450 n=1 Tax=Daucus carota subsp. sativus TaxID=79200 RepID=A0AAF0X7V5_DAUCS|nr:PREDICTED: cytochrome P450 CYP72A219-like [Daucus carota subsp. sativus]WOH03060.1 hypothetical protein DCAR_0522451 [Daucus carota subsp. sativus]
MDATKAFLIAISIAVITVIGIFYRVLNWVWLRPRKLEKYLKEQGFKGNAYRLVLGDMGEYASMIKQEQPRQIKFSENVSLHALPYAHHIINKFGKNSYMWWGMYPRLNILDPELIKEIMTKPNVFQKPHPNPLGNLITGGLLATEGEKWTKHRKLINPAFHLEMLKNMLPAIHLCCGEMINKWEMLVLTTGSSREVDVWPYLQDLSGDVISRTAFGSSHEEGRKIFLLQKEQVDLAIHLIKFSFTPGYRYIPTKANKRMKQVCIELQALLSGIITKREKALETEVNNDDLLGILMESNYREIKEQGIGLSIQEVIDECKLFYFAGSETTSNVLVWTMILLSLHPEWQTRAREEVLQVLGNKTPDLDGLNRLKIVTMILQEVLRLYPPAALLIRDTPQNAKLGDINIPAGVGLTVPVILLHYDHELWGTDAHEFKPQRFSGGVLGATKGKFSYIPFGGGPRICIGQNFAMIEAKMALSMILMTFIFELSPHYKHAPFPILTLQPQHGAPMILHRL